MNKVAYAIFIILLFFPLHALGANCESSATVFYVDYVGGNDTNNGTSTSTPWQHCPGDVGGSWHDSQCSLQAGDRVIFKGGVIYGSGISVSSSGTAEAYITYDGDSGTYASRWASGTDKAVMNGGGTVESAFKLAAKNYIRINNFEMTNYAPAEAIIDGYDTHNPGVSTYVIVSNNYIHDHGDNGFVDEVFTSNPTGWGIRTFGSYWTITNNQFADLYGAMIATGGIDVHTDSAQYNVISYNTFSGDSGWSIAPADSDYLTINNNTFNNTGTLYYPTDYHVNDIFWYITRSNYEYHDLKIYNNLFYYDGVLGETVGATAPIQISTSGVVGTTNSSLNGVYIYNNVLVNKTNSGGPIYIKAKFGLPMNNIYIYNNSIYATQGVGIYVVTYTHASMGPMTNLNIKNNAIYNAGGRNCINIPNENITTINIDYNSCYTVGETQYGLTDEVDTNLTYAQWAALGYDVNAPTGQPTVDPLFTNASNTTHDCTLQSGSPMIGKGVNLGGLCPGCATDIAGTVRGTVWDIGAYEYGAGAILYPSGTIGSGASMSIGSGAVMTLQ